MKHQCLKQRRWLKDRGRREILRKLKGSYLIRLSQLGRAGMMLWLASSGVPPSVVRQ